MKKSFLYIGFFLNIFLLGSCIQEDDLKSRVVTDEILPISSVKVKIDKNDAVNIAKTFFTKGAKSRGVLSNKNVFSIEEIIGTKGEITMYAVNFEGGGFALVGTTKNFYPILAFSEYGYFDTKNMSENVRMTIDEYNAYIENSSDTTRAYYSAAWRKFDEVPAEMSIQSLGLNTTDFQFKIQEMNKWRNNIEANYQCYDLKYAYEQILYGNLKTTVERYLTSPDADLMFILLKTTATEYNVGPLIKTHWEQSSPYNALCASPLVGCVTIAVSQIMKFHQWPTSYNWSVMQNTYPYGATFGTGLLQVQQFLSDVNRFLDTNEMSSSNNIKLLASKELNQWYSITRYNFDSYRVINTVRGGNPIYISGANYTEGGHAWLCDGYKGADGYTTLTLATLKKTSSSKYYEYQDIDKQTDTYQSYFHMNWGASPEHNANTGDPNAGKNGWYFTISSNASNSDVYDPSQDFKTNRRVITFVPKR